MFSKLIASAIAASALAFSISTAAIANEGGGGGEAPPFMTIHNPDGSSATVRRAPGGREVVRKDRKGKKVRVVKRRSPPFAHNHSNGMTSIGIRPGLRVVISPFGIGLSF